MSLAVFFGICLLISGVSIRISISFAKQLGVMDQPGGHKQHDTSTPFVGGVGVMAAFLSALLLTQYYFPNVDPVAAGSIALAAGVIFLTGLVDDIRRLHFRTRLFIQAAVTLYMVNVGGVVITDLGELIPGQRLELGVLAIPFTLFATIGLINAMNMIDGIDGLSGSLSLVSLMLIGLVALLVGGNQAEVTLIIALMGGVVGFLFFNLRYPRNHRARAFLGDNGSMLLGFLFSWLLITNCQGNERVMTPITVLWIVAIPVMDTLCVMLRRIWLGKSPFHADRNHLHHLFLRAGFRVFDTVIIMTLLQVQLGLIGIAGLMFGVPEYIMVLGFMLVFAMYFIIIVRHWRLVPLLRMWNARLGLPSAQARGIYIGHVRREEANALIEALVAELGDRQEYRLSLHEADTPSSHGNFVYGILELTSDINDASLGEIRRVMTRLRARLVDWNKLQVRLFMHRETENDRRSSNQPNNLDGRGPDRRNAAVSPQVQSIEFRGASESPNHAMTV